MSRRDVDVERRRVWLHGGKTTADRWAPLTSWAVGRLARRLDLIDHDPDTPVLYDGDDKGNAGQVSACIALVDVFERAGIYDEPGVRPASVPAWAGRRILDETCRIDVVARRLGMRSLDRTARFIGWSWNESEVE